MSQDTKELRDEAPIAARLLGRIDYLLSIKRVKDPELMVSALEVMTDLADAARGLLDLTAALEDPSSPSLNFHRARIENAISKINGENQ